MDATNRYKNCETLTLDGRRYLGTRVIPEYPRRPDDRFHTVREADRIDLLAQHYFGDARFWWIIADYNGLSFPLEMPEVGTILRVPEYNYAMLVIAQG